ncbi:hypothetical protein [Francisella tularensis]|uniref:hypothetical protein n=1 Tax=Francisella tularensis TaxID=263 RepID=UPI0008F4885D|nr:hypothetical protein [Francisella tularensis]APA83219.1 hypothetical protein N894_1235 [Francisella tularensis subsp. novicida PA10-7858]
MTEEDKKIIHDELKVLRDEDKKLNNAITKLSETLTNFFADFKVNNEKQTIKLIQSEFKKVGFPPKRSAISLLTVWVGLLVSFVTLIALGLDAFDKVYAKIEDNKILLSQTATALSHRDDVAERKILALQKEYADMKNEINQDEVKNEKN